MRGASNIKKTIFLIIGVAIIAIILFAIINLDFLTAVTNKPVESNTTSEFDKFIGTWEMQLLLSNQNVTQTYTFYKNGTLFSHYIDHDTGETHKGWADFTVNDGIMCAKTHPHGAITDGDSYCYTYEFINNDKYMKLTSDELPSVTLVRKGIKEEDKFVGRWESEDGVIFIFKPNGDSSMEGLFYGSGEWELKDDMIYVTLEYEDGQNLMAFYYDFSDDNMVLTLTDPAGGVRIFNKKIN